MRTVELKRKEDFLRKWRLVEDDGVNLRASKEVFDVVV